jgi:hypothetical protein
MRDRFLDAAKSFGRLAVGPNRTERQVAAAYEALFNCTTSGYDWSGQLIGSRLTKTFEATKQSARSLAPPTNLHRGHDCRDLQISLIPAVHGHFLALRFVAKIR